MDQQGHPGFYRPSSDCNTECIEKVEAMISTAILHQEDVWNMLLSLFPDKTNPIATQAAAAAAAEPAGYGNGNPLACRIAVLPVQSHIPEAVMETLEKAIDWSRLAQCRLKGLISENNHPSVRRGTNFPSCIVPVDTTSLTRLDQRTL